MTDPRLAELVERAFDYRGYVTLRRHDGSALVGFVYDRGPSHLEVYDETATRRLRIDLAEIASIDFTGEDTARKSHEMWERRKGKLEPRETPAHGGWDETRPVLVLVALDRELRSVARALGLSLSGNRARGRIGGNDLIALSLGVGGGARSAVNGEWPGLVLSCGFCGALDPVLGPGDLVLATAVNDESGDRIAAPAALRTAAAAALQGLSCYQGELVCTSSVAATAAEKRALARPGALAVDMESFTVARAAADAGIPWAALRAVVDPLDSSLPSFTREDHRSHLLPALKHAASGPSATWELIRLARDARRAGIALEKALRQLGPALGSLEAHP